MANKMCTEYGQTIKIEENADAHWMDSWFGIRPTDIKRVRVTCPKCKRRMLTSGKSGHDGAVIHTMPRHKVKGWWKKRNKKKKRHKRGKKDR